MIKVRLVKKIEGIEVQNGDTITLGLKVGMAGASAYQSYLATTTDDPKKTEAEWSSGFVQLQSDWNQADNLAVDYIKYKPTIPTATSDLTNDSDFVSDAYYVHTDNNYDDAAALEVAKISDKQDATDALLETDSDTIVGAINEVNSIAKGANQALSFDDYQAVLAAILISGLNAGQNLYVDTLDVPDLWVKVVEAASVPYTYISDTQFVTDILAGTQIGYYRLALLETQKVDLTNYYTKDETDQAIEDYAEPLRTTDQNYVSDAELEVLRDTSGVNTGDETQDTIGDLIELTELATVTDTTKIAASDSAFLKWFSGLTIYTYIRTKLLAVANTWALLQTFTSGLKTTKIIPNSDSSGVVIRNAADTADVVKVDTANNKTLFGGSLEIRNVAAGGDPIIYMKGGFSTGTALLIENAFGSVRILPYQTGDTTYMQSSQTAFSFSKSGGMNGTLLSFLYNNTIFNGKARFGDATTPETTIDINGTTTLRDWVYLNNGTHTGDAVGDKRFKITSGVLIYERCTALHATRGSGTWVTDFQINAEGVIMPKQAASAPTYVKGGMYFDTTLNKMRIGGATDWETLTSI